MKRSIDITEQEINICDGLDVFKGTIYAIYEMWFDVDAYFGIKMRDEDAWINFYTEWHPNGDITAEYTYNGYDEKGNAAWEWIDWELTDNEKQFFRNMMEEYSKKEYGMTLTEFYKEYEDGE